MAEVPANIGETERLQEAEVVPYIKRDANETPHGKNKKPKRTLSPEKKTKRKKQKVDLDSGDTSLVLTASEKDKVIT